MYALVFSWRSSKARFSLVSPREIWRRLWGIVARDIISRGKPQHWPVRHGPHFRQRDRRPRDYVRPGAALCPRLHRADTCARASHQVSARFRQCPHGKPNFGPDSTFSARSIRCRTRYTDRQCGSHCGLLSLIPTVANCRDRHGFMRTLPLRIGWLPTVVDSLLATLEK
jgi:hypothetical protein